MAFSFNFLKYLDKKEIPAKEDKKYSDIKKPEGYTPKSNPVKELEKLPKKEELVPEKRSFLKKILKKTKGLTWKGVGKGAGLITLFEAGTLAGRATRKALSKKEKKEEED